MYQNEHAAGMGGNPQVDQATINLRTVARALRHFAACGDGPLPRFDMGDWKYCIAGWTLAVLDERAPPVGFDRRIYIRNRAAKLLDSGALMFCAFWWTPGRAADKLERLADARERKLVAARKQELSRIAASA